MKKFLLFLGVAAFMAIPANGAFAWDMSYLNPLPYFGIGQNKTSFSLNPFTGFKNCNPCKKVEKCNRCATAKPINKCNTCHRAYVEEVPNCGCQVR